MSTADLAIAAITAINLTVIYLNHRRDMNLVDKVADRLRLVSPVKPPAQDDTGGTVEELDRRRPA